MKRLNFQTDADSRERFQIIYQGFLLGAPEGGIKGIEQMRRALKLMDKLDVISAPVLGGDSGTEPLYLQSGDAIRQLSAEGGELLLDEAEITMLKAHINTVPWRVSLARIVVATDDFLTSAPSV